MPNENRELKPDEWQLKWLLFFVSKICWLVFESFSGNQAGIPFG
jgi:hypothetical protein